MKGTNVVELEKKYGLSVAITMVMGIVIGIGIFFKAEAILKASSLNPKVAISAWIIGGIITILLKENGFKELISRIFQFKLSLKWIVISLFIPFIYIGFAIFIGNYQNGNINEVKLGNIVNIFSPTALALLIAGPLGEEFGWRGFLLPELLKKYSLIYASIILGLVWGIWHLPLYYTTVFSSLEISSMFISQTVATSIIMSIIFIYTKGSILIAIIYHWLINVLGYVFSTVFIGIESDFQIYQLIGKILIIIILIVLIGKSEIFNKYETTANNVYKK